MFPCIDNGNGTLTYTTSFGKLTIRKNDVINEWTFSKGNYWSEEDIRKNIHYINPAKNVIEIGAHCGTHTLPYAKTLNEGSMVYTFEPQLYMLECLNKTILDNDLQSKVKIYNNAVWYKSCDIEMESICISPTAQSYNKSLEDCHHQNIMTNYGAVCVGKHGIPTKAICLDDMGFENVGFIHSDAEGSENLIFYGARELIRQCRPIIYYENYRVCGSALFDHIKANYDIPEEILYFDVKRYCMEELQYRTYIHGQDSYLIP
jgi:FkbM family methyltransferase